MDQQQENEQREEILGGNISDCEENVVYYYRSQKEEDDEDLKEDNLDLSQSPTAAEGDHISKFLKLPRAPRTTRKMGRLNH